jgi:hypothetical protein
MPSTQKSTPRKSSGPRKTTRSGGSAVKSAQSMGSSAAKSAKSAVSAATQSAKSAASSLKSTAGSLGGKVAKSAKSVKNGANLSTGQLIAGAAGLAAAATAAGAVLYKMKSGSGHRTVYHVKPNGEGWAVEGDGAERATSTHETKKEALSAARELAHKKVPSQLVVHKADGSVQEKFSYDAQ